MRFANVCVAVFLVLLCGSFTIAAEITFGTLLNELTNLDVLADFPSPSFVCRQFSSYDRRSTDPNIATDENWFANGDAGQFIRTETRDGQPEYVMMDANGPGAIVRIWSANPDGGGIIRVYLDGSATAAIEMPMTDMLKGETMPFVSPIANITSKGWNSYLPIPYTKRCKVTVSKNGLYYHINYRTYPKDTAVETFSLDSAKKVVEKIRQTAEKLQNPEKLYDMPAHAQTRNYKAELAAGADCKIDVSGKESAIYSFTCKADAEKIDTALRGCVVEIYFDKQKQAAVVAPLGDFFGTAPGLNPYRSLSSGVLENGTMYSHWVMPFKKAAVIKFTNHTAFPIKISGDVMTAERTWNEQTMYFNAKWRAGYSIQSRPHRDWNYISCTGKGRYVGNMLHITNPLSSWWGEGDEKIYLDGEKFPSTFGTGTEDYYGYAWCWPGKFTHAYHNQARCDGPDNYGNTCVSRFHILDSLPFDSAFRFDMEIWHHAAGFTIDLAEISYWYAMPQTKDNFPAISPKELIIPALPTVTKTPGVIEGETMRVISHSGGTVFNQANFVWSYSGGQAMWWVDAAIGNTLELGFNVEKAGRYKIEAVFSYGNSTGIAALSINDQCAGSRDWWYPDWILGGVETLGVFKLKAGENMLKAVCEPKNPKSFGNIVTLDYIKLTPID